MEEFLIQRPTRVSRTLRRRTVPGRRAIARDCMRGRCFGARQSNDARSASYLRRRSSSEIRWLTCTRQKPRTRRARDERRETRDAKRKDHKIIGFVVGREYENKRVEGYEKMTRAYLYGRTRARAPNRTGKVGQRPWRGRDVDRGAGTGTEYVVRRRVADYGATKMPHA